ncbi:MAG: amidohydrolase family protein, partial [Planctomycetota bacterium]
SPHAPYSVEPQNYRRCLAAAEKRSVPLATHLAETREEADFLCDHAGPFRELWETIGGWDDDVPTFDGSPVAFAKHLGLLDAAVPVVLAHGNYLEPGDIDLLAAGRASVAYCPRTHAYFGHDPHPLVELLARGVNVCLGTDSRASSPDLDLLAEVRHVHDHRPDVDISTLWSMATWRGAEALGLTGVAGSVAPGCRADLLALPDPSGDAPLATVLQDIEHRTVLCSEVEPLRLSR